MLTKEQHDNLKGVWFTSDLHFSHKNILKYCPESRKFDSVEEMDLHLLDMWNSTVSKEDTVFFLGDLTLSFKVAQRVIPKLSGSKINLIPGNHDAWHPMNSEFKKYENIVKELNPNAILCKPRETLNIYDVKLLLCHFPWADTDESPTDKHKRLRPQESKYEDHYLVHGHTHSTYEKRLTHNSVDVGYDAFQRMVSLEEIYELARASKIDNDLAGEV